MKRPQKSRFWWIWKGKIGRGMWPLSKKVPKSAVGPFGTKRDAEEFRKGPKPPPPGGIIADLKAAAVAWATDSQMTPPFTTGEVTPIKNTTFVQVVVSDSKNRSAICTFKADGSRDVFERTDRISGG